ncbi:sigma 54-interacting transcriptional regulator [Alloacidobacterium dinghuense]|uniref:Sigma 54-interacting transcriptional regulator n=1 Tax=Alloacidobacterium dinghuense TaxID=2763107 RepID=A0A7G8BGH5_9BACT|nr:sigma 54-interacting transcriptional regulator [Alloacidobacterium dinghuense]QNI31645.1 sigma 54-interacting transcriptional regulator [Alloacidobacterium dinghuense]
MAEFPPYEPDPLNGVNAIGTPEEQFSIMAQLRATANVIPAYVWYASPSGVLVFVNSRCAEYLGLPRDHPLRLGADPGGAWDSHIHLLHPDDHEGTRRVWSTCLRTGSAGEVAFRVRNAVGGYRWFLSRAEPLRMSDGTLVCWVGINLDIDERKQAEFYLDEGQRLAHTGSWTLNNDGFEHWSSELFKIHGLDPATKAPSVSEYLALVHPEDREFVSRNIQEMFAAHSGFDFTKRIVRPDGAIRSVRCVGVPLSHGDSFQAFVGTGIDVTEQEQLTEELRRNELELRQVLDLAPQLIGIYGPSRERLYLNKPGLDFAGISLEAWRQTQAPAAFIHPDDRERELAYFAEVQSNGSGGQLELRLRDGDGSYRWFLTRYNSLRDEHGQILRWYVACTDIDDRKRAEEGLQRENAALREELNQTSMFEEIVGSSEPLRKVLSHVSKVAISDSTVLILGQTGTGKELIARAIHKRSKRAGRAFIGVNCGAIPASLIASELFGHEKGAFTGATHRRLGRFEAANGGTILLDEVGDLPPDIQIALLRVLQEREIERVGSDRPIPVDVRVLAATHRDLDELVSEGKFRQDLLYRLNVVPISMPSLRERAADIPILVEYFIARFGRKMGKKFQTIEKKTLKILQEYGWPGNVRELQNVIERAVTLSDSDTFSVDEAWLKRKPTEVAHSSAALNGALLAHEKEVIEAALAQSHGRISGPAGAATQLGIPDSTLEAKIKRLGIDKFRFKS